MTPSRPAASLLRLARPKCALAFMIFALSGAALLAAPPLAADPPPAVVVTPEDPFEVEVTDAWTYYWAGLLSGGDLRSFDQGLAHVAQARALLDSLPPTAQRQDRVERLDRLETTISKQRAVAEVTLRGQFPLVALLRKSLFLNSGALGNYELVDDPGDVAISKLSDDLRDNVLSRWGAMAQTDVTVYSSLPEQALDDKVLALLSTSPKINLRPMADVLHALPPELAGPVSRGEFTEVGEQVREHFGAERFIFVTIREVDVAGDVYAMELGARIFDGNTPDTFSILGLTFDRRSQQLPLLLTLLGLFAFGLAAAGWAAREKLMRSEVLSLGTLAFFAGITIPNALLGLLGGIEPPLEELAQLSAWWTVFAALVVLTGTPIAYTSLLKRFGSSIPAIKRANEFGPQLAIAHGAGVAAYMARAPIVYDPDHGWLTATLMLAPCVSAARLVAQLRARQTLSPGYTALSLGAMLLAGPAYFADSLPGVIASAALALGATAYETWRVRHHDHALAAQPQGDGADVEVEWDLDDEELATLVARARRPSFQSFPPFLQARAALFFPEEPNRERRTQWCFLYGQRGSGKTATCDALLALLPERAVVLRGACSPPHADGEQGSETRPFEVFVRAFESVGVFSVDEPEEDLFSSIEGRVISAIPIVSMLLPSGDEGGAAVSDRGELYARVVRELIKQTRRNQRRVVLVLDDIQWLDAASLELLLHLMARFPQGGEHAVSFLLSGRELPETLTRNPTSRKLLPHERQVCVELDETQRLTMLQSAIGFDARSAHLLDDAVTDREGKGNIGWLLMLIEAVARSGQVVYDERAQLYRLTIEDGQALPVPDNLKKIVGAAYEKLEREDQELVRVAACLGYSINLEVLARVVERHRLEVIERLELIGETTGLVEDDLSSDDYFKFVSTQRYLAIRDYLGIREVNPRERQSQLLRDLHLKIARVMETLVSERHTTLADVAHHYWLAGLRDLGKALFYCRGAARAARDVFAFDAEEHQLRRALACAEIQSQVSSDELTRSSAARQRKELELELELLPYERAHILGRQDLQQEQADQAERSFLRDVSDGHVDVPLPVLIAMTRACYDARRFEQALEMAQALIALGGPDEALPTERVLDAADLTVRDLAHVEGLHFVGISLDPRQQVPERLEYLERAERAANALDLSDERRRALLARVCNSLAEQLSQPAAYDFERARASFNQSISIKNELKPRDKPGLARAYGGLGRLHLFAARDDEDKRAFLLKKARAYFLEDVELCQDYGDVAGECQMHSHLGECALLMGELDEALTHYERSLALAQNAISRGFALVGVMRVQRAREDEAGAHDGARRIVALLEEQPDLPPFLHKPLLEALDGAALTEAALPGLSRTRARLGAPDASPSQEVSA